MNGNVIRQATALQEHHGVRVEILTWPSNDLWTGPLPKKSNAAWTPPARFENGGLTFHVINPDEAWNERTPSPSAWAAAVEFGVRIIQEVRPDIVHLHHWVGLWWMLEAAQRVGVATTYTNHDWGIACLRTLLVMGDGAVCDGQVSASKCAECIHHGRGFVGRLNERVVETMFGRRLIEMAYHTPLRKVLQRRGAVRIPLRDRVDLHLSRARGVLQKLDGLFTPSHFGCRFFAGLGVPEDRIYVQPWYHDPLEKQKAVSPSQPFTITYIGRVSREKGLDLLFDAMARVTSATSIELRIAGADRSPYCLDLQRRYAERVGEHRVQWLEWANPEPLFLNTDVVTIPSIWVDNTPLSLVEALAYQVPVISIRVPPVEELVKDGANGYLADYNSVDSLAFAISRAASDKARIRLGGLTFPKVSTSREYTQVVKDAYVKALGSSAANDRQKRIDKARVGLVQPVRH